MFDQVIRHEGPIEFQTHRLIQSGFARMTLGYRRVRQLHNALRRDEGKKFCTEPSNFEVLTRIPRELKLNSDLAAPADIDKVLHNSSFLCSLMNSRTGMGSGGGESLEREPVASIPVSAASSELGLMSSEKENTGSDYKTGISTSISPFRWSPVVVWRRRRASVTWFFFPGRWDTSKSNY